MASAASMGRPNGVRKPLQDHRDLAMDKASLYACANCLQKRDATGALDEFLPKMQWESGELVLDVGCGPGDVTAEILLPRLPSDLRRLVGSDLSFAMVKHATERYGRQGPGAPGGGVLSFAQMDIADVVVCAAQPSALVADLLASQPSGQPSARPSAQPGFSKLFSFYCLHWVPEQRRATQSIHRLLAPGGEALLVFLARSPMFELYEQMATMPKWAAYMTDIKRFISPYQHCENPAAEFHNLLRDVGLEVLHCSCREQTFDFGSMESLRKSVTAVNPFLDRIPSKLRGTFIDDCMAEINRLGLILENNNNNSDNMRAERVNTRYSLLVAHARKPLY